MAKDPHLNPQGIWDDNYFQHAGQYGITDPSSPYGSLVSTAINGLQDYINKQQGFYQNQYNNQTNLYNAQNSQALGAQDQNAQQAFLNSVLNPEQKQQGSIEYGYNLGQNNENAMYGLNSTANQQNRDLALQKLANDENWANQNLNLQQGNQNANTIDSLNQRGMLYGQTPTGAYQGQAMGGMTGLAGQQAGRVNQEFANQHGQLQTTYGLNQQGVNQDYTQQQNMLNENHGYNTSENAFNAANQFQNQQNQYAYNTAQANNQLAMYKDQLQQQKQQGIAQAKANAASMLG